VARASDKGDRQLILGTGGGWCARLAAALARLISARIAVARIGVVSESER
jgi:hypothetical protein